MEGRTDGWKCGTSFTTSVHQSLCSLQSLIASATHLSQANTGYRRCFSVSWCWTPTGRLSLSRSSSSTGLSDSSPKGKHILRQSLVSASLALQRCQFLDPSTLHLFQSTHLHHFSSPSVPPLKSSLKARPCQKTPLLYPPAPSHCPPLRVPLCSP